MMTVDARFIYAAGALAVVSTVLAAFFFAKWRAVERRRPALPSEIELAKALKAMTTERDDLRDAHRATSRRSLEWRDKVFALESELESARMVLAGKIDLSKNDRGGAA
jgi:hypothetical protein